MGQIIADIERNSREIIRIEVSEFKGKELINLRIWYSHFDGSYRPTQKGVALDISKYEDLKAAIDKIGTYLKDKEDGVIPDINEPIEEAVAFDDSDVEGTEKESNKKEETDSTKEEEK